MRLQHKNSRSTEGETPNLAGSQQDQNVYSERRAGAGSGRDSEVAPGRENGQNEIPERRAEAGSGRGSGGKNSLRRIVNCNVARRGLAPLSICMRGCSGKVTHMYKNLMVLCALYAFH